jgi:hypothetical protein
LIALVLVSRAFALLIVIFLVFVILEGVREGVMSVELSRCVIIYYVFNLVKILTLEILVVSVFDLTHSSTKQRFHLRYLRPFGAYLSELLKDELVFLSGPVSSHDFGIQNVVPSLPALAAEPSRKIAGDDHPVLCAKLIDFLYQHCIFVRSPLAALVLDGELGLPQLDLELLNRVEVMEFLLLLEIVPSLEASDLGLVWHVLADSVEGVVTVSSNKPFQFFILYRKKRQGQKSVL